MYYKPTYFCTIYLYCPCWIQKMIQETSNLDWDKNKTRHFGQAFFYTIIIIIIIRSINKPLFRSGLNKQSADEAQWARDKQKIKEKTLCQVLRACEYIIYLSRFNIINRGIINPAIMSRKIKI